MTLCELPLLQDDQTYRVTGASDNWRVSIPCKTVEEANSVVLRCLEMSSHAVAVVWVAEQGERRFVARYSHCRTACIYPNRVLD
jgi:hypothetical protein